LILISTVWFIQERKKKGKKKIIIYNYTGIENYKGRRTNYERKMKRRRKKEL
jgi:hypothetical protein